MELEIFIHADWSKYRKEFDYNVHNSDYTSVGEILLEVRTIQFESPPEMELRKKAYALLMKEKQEVLANAQVKAMEIEQQAQELLALEDKSNGQKGEDDDIPF